MDLPRWLVATWLVCHSPKGVSSKHIQRELGCTYKTAWYMTRRIRLAIQKILVDVLVSDRVEVGGRTVLVRGDVNPLERRFAVPHDCVPLLQRAVAGTGLLTSGPVNTGPASNVSSIEYSCLALRFVATAVDMMGKATDRAASTQASAHARAPCNRPRTHVLPIPLGQRSTRIIVIIIIATPWHSAPHLTLLTHLPTIDGIYVNKDSCGHSFLPNAQCGLA